MQNVEMNNKFQHLFSVIYSEFNNPEVWAMPAKEQWIHLKEMSEAKEVKENILSWFKAYPDNEYVQSLDTLWDTIDYYSKQITSNISIDDFKHRMPVRYLIKLWERCESQLAANQDTGMGM